MKQIAEIKKQKDAKQKEAKSVIDEFNNVIKELEKKKKEMIKELDAEINFNTKEMNKVKKTT